MRKHNAANVTMVGLMFTCVSMALFTLVSMWGVTAYTTFIVVNAWKNRKYTYCTIWLLNIQDDRIAL